MKKNIGSQLALYPAPVTVVGAIQSPLTLECNVVDIYDTLDFENFICTIDSTYVAEEYLNGEGKVNYTTLKPVLFEFPTYQYLRTGEVIGKCLSFKKTWEK
jgi:flavin reductase (DIM6/NTAB) family NADH-FMN oxidoreductase RutF